MYRLPFALIPLVLVIVAAVLVAALTGGDPPARAARVSAGHVGPGPVARTLSHGAYRVALRLSPNRPTASNHLAVRVTKAGRAVAGAKVTARFDMVEMDMGNWTYKLPERSAGRYARKTSAPAMTGDWNLAVEVAPRGGAPFTVRVVDRAGV